MSTWTDTLYQPIDLTRVARQLAVMVGCRQAPTLRRSRRRRATMPTIEQPAVDDSGGCGWFDSSHDLNRGLLVVEHRQGALLGEGLPLPVWLHQAVRGDAAT